MLRKHVFSFIIGGICLDNLEWDPAYKPSVTSLPIPFNSWVDDPPELNEYMLPALRKNALGTLRPGEAQTRLDHFLVEYVQNEL